MTNDGFERTSGAPSDGHISCARSRSSSAPGMLILAGDALDMVVSLASGWPIARVRRQAAVARCEGESPGPLRTLPVTALSHAPGAAVLVRFTLPCADTLDVHALSERLPSLAVPRAVIDAVIRALRVAEMARVDGGPPWAAFNCEGCGGLVRGAALAGVAHDAPLRTACHSGSTRPTRKRNGPGACAVGLRTILPGCF